ncbi:MAG: insulinase family protein [Alphaproteobacteria bacterium]|nr:insulinase family protein [Alphaproteobacteria bacterium]
MFEGGVKKIMMGCLISSLFLLIMNGGDTIAYGETAPSQTDHIAPQAADNEKSDQVLKLPFKLKPSNVSLDSIKIQDVTSSQDVHVWLVENNDIPVVTFKVMFADAGSKNEPKGKRGLLSILASMVDEGAGPYDAQAFKKFLLENNIELFVNVDKDTFIIGFSVPKTGVKMAFDALRMILTQITFPEKEIDKIKRHKHISYIQAIDNEGQKGGEKLNEVIFGDHPYATTTKEHLDDLAGITTEDMQAYMRMHLTKDRMIGSACGSITKEELKILVDATFKDIPPKATAQSVHDASLHHLGSTSNVPLDIPQSLILFAHPGFKRDDPDYFAFDLALEIFGSGDFGSRLMQRVREDKGLVYGIGATKVIDRHAQLILGHASTRTQSVSKVIDLIRSEWKKFIDLGVTQDELDRAKQRMIGVFPLRIADTKNITAALLSIQYHKLGIDYLSKRTAAIQAIDHNHLNTLLKNRFKESLLTFIVVGQDKVEQNDVPQDKKESVA